MKWGDPGSLWHKHTSKLDNINPLSPQNEISIKKKKNIANTHETHLIEFCTQFREGFPMQDSGPNFVHRE